MIKKVSLSLALIFVLFCLWGAWSWYSIVPEEVSFYSGDLVLRGTLYLPRHQEDLPAVVLVHGSGEVSRRSMALYAWLFAFKGYAALAYDKRGVGQSDGEKYEWREFVLDDLAADAVAAYDFLQSHDRIAANKVGFFGASQGAWVVSLATNQVESPAFMIMASASVSTIAEDRIFGRKAQVRHAGFDDNAINQAADLIRSDHEVTRSGSGYDLYRKLWDSYQNQDWFKEVYANSLPEPMNSPHRLWEKSILDFDPRPLLSQINIPSLWIFGDPELDRFSPVDMSVGRLEEAKLLGACYQIIQIDKAGHTLELENGSAVQSLLKVRIPLIADIYRWLVGLDSPSGQCNLE